MTVLYAEDDLDDIDTFSYMLHTIDPSVTLTNVRNGQEAIEYLKKNDTLPDIFFLDINMPIMDGMTCLKFIKKDRRFKSIPVVVYSTGLLPEDNDHFYQLGALYCMQKPSAVKEGIDQLRTILNKK